MMFESGEKWSPKLGELSFSQTQKNNFHKEVSTSKIMPPKKTSGPTVKDLREEAKAKKIKGYSTMKKAELIKALGKPKASPKKSPAKKTASKKTYVWETKLGKGTARHGDLALEPSGKDKSKWKPIWSDSDVIEKYFKRFQANPNNYKTNLGRGRSVILEDAPEVYDFKKMTVSWNIGTPSGDAILFEDSIRRVEK